MYELEALFTQDAGKENVRGVLRYRVKTIKSGDLLEAEAYPVFTRETDIKGAVKKATGEAQRKVNRRNSMKRLRRKLECNFGAGSVFLTLTYAVNPSLEEGEKELTKFLRRLRYQAEKAGKRLKYVSVTEVSGKGRVHHHLVVTGVSRETMEKAWKKGYANARMYQGRASGWGGLSAYMLKSNAALDDFEDARRWRCSKGLKDPVVTVSDFKISIRKMERILQDAQDAGREILERAYRGYVLEERPVIKKSEWLPGVYLYAAMRRSV